MIFGVYAEILCMDQHYGTAKDRDEAFELLRKAFDENGTHASAVAAGDADEPMKVVAFIDAGGDIWEGDTIAEEA